MSKMYFIFGITACNCLNINTRLLQDKETTVRHDCDQSEHVPAEQSSHLIIFIIIYIFKRDLNYIQFLTNLCKVCATAALN